MLLQFREALLLGPRIVEGAESTVRSEKGELEDFNVRTLYDKLEDQTLYLAQQLTRQQEDLRGFYERMSQQTDGLKVRNYQDKTIWNLASYLVVLSYKHCCCPAEGGLQNPFVLCACAVKIVRIRR